MHGREDDDFPMAKKMVKLAGCCFCCRFWLQFEEDHYHGWSGFGCMANTDGSCKTGIGGTAIGAQFILVCMVIVWSGILSAIIFALLKLTGRVFYGQFLE